MCAFRVLTSASIWWVLHTSLDSAPRLPVLRPGICRAERGEQDAAVFSDTISRRRHAAELKWRVLAACAEPGAAVAQVALVHDLNANLFTSGAARSTREVSA